MLRVAQLLTGIVSLWVAAWFGIPAVVQAWRLVSLPRNSPRQPCFEFCLGDLTLSGWSFVAIGGGAGILLAAFSCYVLFALGARRERF